MEYCGHFWVPRLMKGVKVFEMAQKNYSRDEELRLWRSWGWFHWGGWEMWRYQMAIHKMVKTIDRFDRNKLFLMVVGSGTRRYSMREFGKNNQKWYENPRNCKCWNIEQRTKCRCWWGSNYGGNREVTFGSGPFFRDENLCVTNISFWTFDDSGLKCLPWDEVEADSIAAFTI